MEKEKKLGYLVLDGFSYVDSLPFYHGDLNGNKFPIAMSKDRVPESKLWVCAALFQITEEMSLAAADGNFGYSELHIKDCNSAYLLMGQEGAVTAEVTLGRDVYTLTTPSAVFIPAGMPHAIRPIGAKAGVFGGITTVCYAGSYTASPVPADAVDAGDTSKYVFRDYLWSGELPAHKGKSTSKGYAILLSKDRLEESNTWICPSMRSRSQEECDAFKLGISAGATPHYHDNGDEMYLVLGDPRCCTLRITLDAEEYFVIPPAVVYMPRGVTHSLESVRGMPGVYGGPNAIFSGPAYLPIPNPEHKKPVLP